MDKLKRYEHKYWNGGLPHCFKYCDPKDVADLEKRLAEAEADILRENQDGVELYRDFLKAEDRADRLSVIADALAGEME